MLLSSENESYQQIQHMTRSKATLSKQTFWQSGCCHVPSGILYAGLVAIACLQVVVWVAMGPQSYWLFMSYLGPSPQKGLFNALVFIFPTEQEARGGALLKIMRYKNKRQGLGRMIIYIR